MLAEAAEANQTTPPRADAGSARFCGLFEACQPALRRLVAAYVISSADREDLLQDIAAGIWKSLPGFRGESSERTWIYRIAHNIAIRYAAGVRTRNAREPVLKGVFDRPSTDAGAEATLLLNEGRRILVAGIRELPPADRQIVTLHLEGLSAAEIEEITQVSQGAVAARLTRIRQKLSERVRAGGREQ